MPPHRPNIVRFSEKYTVNSRTGCWEWHAGVSRGYGYLRVDKSNNVLAHRFAYEHFVGRIPEGMLVIHNCNNPTCVNPHHLRVGTHSENMKDLVKSGRAIGRPKKSQTSSVGIKKIKSLLRSGYTQIEVGDMLGVHRTTIQRALSADRDCYSGDNRYLSEREAGVIQSMLNEGATISAIANLLKVDRKTIRNWREKLSKGTS